MDQAIYAGLPEPHRAMVNEIESSSGLEVLVASDAEVSASLPNMVNDSGGGDAASAIVTYDLALIVYSGEMNLLTEDDYFHELSHIHRYHAQSVPQLHNRTDANGRLAAVLENEIEHQYIYERHFPLSAAANSRFMAEVSDAWSRYPWKVNLIAKRLYTLSRYWKTKAYGDAGTLALAQSVLGKDRKAVEEVCQKLERWRGDKARTTAMFLQYIGVPKKEFFLRRWDARNGRYWDTDI